MRGRKEEILIEDAARKKAMEKMRTWPIGQKEGIPTGYKYLDIFSDALKPGEVSLIGGRPCMGKTKLAINIAYNISTMGKMVAYYTAEESRADVEILTFALMEGIPPRSVKHWNMNDDEWKRFIAATRKYEDMSLTIRKTSSVYEIKELQKNENKDIVPDVLIIDSLQSLRKNRYEKEMTPKERLMEIKDLAKRLNIPIIVTTQLTREIELRDDHHPHRRDIDKSGLWEGSWDSAFLLYRDNYYDANLPESDLEITVTKSFSSLEISTSVGWDFESLKIEDISDKPNPNAKVYTYEDLIQEDEEYDEYEDEDEEIEVTEEEIAAYELSVEMKDHIVKEEYEKAIDCANRLKMLSFYSYQTDIRECYQRCAKEGNKEALLYIEKQLQSQGKVVEEEFYYLNALENKGYISAFDRLGDCYQYGIGCERDSEKAKRAYISGILFKGNDRCRIQAQRLMDDYDANGPYANLLSEDYEQVTEARIKIANQIFEGLIKEYPCEAAYPIYQNLYKDSYCYSESEDTKYGSLPIYNLAICLRDGIGTKPNLYAAYYMFIEAYDTYKCFFPEERKYEFDEEWLEQIDYEIERIGKRCSDVLESDMEDAFDKWMETEEDFIQIP